MRVSGLKTLLSTIELFTHLSSTALTALGMWIRDAGTAREN
jgi:hypothetical protein